MYRIKFIEDSLVYLRPYCAEDAELVFFGKNHPDVRETLFLFRPQTLNQVRSEMEEWTNSREIVLFTICAQEDDQAVGQTAFVRMDYISRAAIFYIAIYDPNKWSKGYGGAATKLMVRYGFDVLNLNRIQLHVCCENVHAIRAYEKAGFQIEGTLRQAMYHHDRYCDFYVMGILREDFYKRGDGVEIKKG